MRVSARETGAKTRPLNVPGLSGSSGLPIGVQLVARPFAEPLLIESGRLVQSLIGRST